MIRLDRLPYQLPEGPMSEASAQPQDIPMHWRNYAFHGYLALQRLDAAVLEPRLPAAIFYNLLLTGRRP